MYRIYWVRFPAAYACGSTTMICGREEADRVRRRYEARGYMVTVKRIN